MQRPALHRVERLCLYVALVLLTAPAEAVVTVHHAAAGHAASGDGILEHHTLALGLSDASHVGSAASSFSTRNASASAGVAAAAHLAPRRADALSRRLVALSSASKSSSSGRGKELAAESTRNESKHEHIKHVQTQGSDKKQEETRNYPSEKREHTESRETWERNEVKEKRYFSRSMKDTRTVREEMNPNPDKGLIWGFPKIFWALFADVVAMGLFILCVPWILYISKRRPPAWRTTPATTAQRSLSNWPERSGA